MMSNAKLVAHGRAVVFLAWLALVIASGLTLPAANAPHSVLNSVLIVGSAMATALVGLAVAANLVELWGRFKAAADRADYVVSVVTETVAAVPVLLLCLIVPLVGAFQAIEHLVSLL